MTSEFYQQRAAQFQLQVGQCDKIIQQLAWSRIAVALAIALLIYVGFQDALFFSAVPILVIVFVYLVGRQSKKEHERKILLNHVELNRLETEATQFQYAGFPAGERFIDPTHPYTHDLDIFGNGSVFQYLNRCATHLGENKLAHDLAHLKFSKEEIAARQAAIQELASKLEFRQQCWAVGKQVNKPDYELKSLYGWLKESDLLLDKSVIQKVKWVMPAVTCMSLVGIAFDSVFQGIFFLLFSGQIAFTARFGKPIDDLQIKLVHYRDLLENYAALLREVVKETFSSSLMQQHVHRANEAAEQVHQFSRLVNALETRMNFFARVFGNGLFLYDLHSVTKLEVWRKKNAHQLPIWMESLAEWDALLSFASLHYNHPRYAFAEFKSELAIEGNEIGHLLIPTSSRINNTFTLGKPASVLLITGANMAGKSTFLRAMGVNYVLAQNGSPVCATRWICPIVNLRTGMRTSDSLQENKSYFFAELNRLQSIVEELRSGEPLVILLDEILKGTNSTDKQTGSRELIKQLMQQKALTVIATHDIALGDMEQQYPNQISNACFEGQIENDELTFDYKLHPGVAQKANATFLMKKMGIIPG